MNSDKTGKQCRERWHNHLDPELDKKAFELEDEVKVFELQKELGNSWCEIAKHFEGKNDNFIKNCFYSAIRRNLRKYNRDKVPSKQLKGTINSLLRNAKKRKILMNFPEHEEFRQNKLNTNGQNYSIGCNIPDSIVKPSVTYNLFNPCSDIFSMALSIGAGYLLYEDLELTNTLLMNRNYSEFDRRDSSKSDLSTISSFYIGEDKYAEDKTKRN